LKRYYALNEKKKTNSGVGRVSQLVTTFENKSVSTFITPIMSHLNISTLPNGKSEEKRKNLLRPGRIITLIAVLVGEED